MPGDFGSVSGKTSRPVFLRLVILLTLILFSTTTAHSGSDLIFKQRDGKSEQAAGANAPSYIDEPLEKLIRSLPELKTLQPAADQEELRTILEKTGENVDKLFDTFSDLEAKETVTEERLDPITGKPWKTQRTDLNAPSVQPNLYNMQQDQYTYLIVRKGNLLQTAIEEYRRDADGNEAPPGVKFLSSGFASSVLYFSRVLQSESKYRYLGEQQLGTRSVYVVAFAQIPGIATISFKMRKPEEGEINWLSQGIAWVDEYNFQILQMKTALLAPVTLHKDCDQKDQMDTIVKFGEVQPIGLAKSMWLPTEASVHEGIDLHSLKDRSDREVNCKAYFAEEFRNVHKFTDYRRHTSSEAVKPSLEESARKNDAQASPYLEEPLTELVRRIPELKGIRPAVDQQQLPMILQKTGSTVDQFFANMVDVIASEKITQERMGSRVLLKGMLVPATERLRDSYLILRRNDEAGARFHEFRMDAQGNGIAEEGSNKGFVVTSGFALSIVHFSTAVQWDSRFLYLGDQKVEGRDTYVLAFAQIPGEAHNTVTIMGQHGVTVHLLTQGIAWVDKSNFHILRVRTDLLARQPEIGLEQQTTKIRFSEVQLGDVPVPLLLPRDVDVNLKFADPAARQDAVSSGEFLTFGTLDVVFRNVHRYTNYRRYTVYTKISNPQ